LRRYKIKKVFLHHLPDARQLFEVVASELKILPSLVEKDYWIMHCLWGLQQQGFQFVLKGGTSLSKGFRIIERFIVTYLVRNHTMQGDYTIIPSI